MYRYELANRFKRFMRQSAVPRPMSWFYARTLNHIDRVVYRLTRGRATFTSWITGLQVGDAHHDGRAERPAAHAARARDPRRRQHGGDRVELRAVPEPVLVQQT